MPVPLTCPQGHQWQAPPDGRPLCPCCGSAPLSCPTGAAQVAPAKTTVLPPPRAPGEDRPDALATLPPRPRPKDGTDETLTVPSAGDEEYSAPSRPVVTGYEVLGELGRGGMGVVYKARQIKLNRLVALKMILAGSHAGADDLARFSTEAEAVAGLRHPHIVQIYDIGEQGGMPYFCLEFVEGGSLEGQLDGAPWTGPRAAGMVELLARAMQAAHERGIIHRDLKPANVLLTADGEPKITDFGLAKRLDQDSGRTRTGTIMGTPSYMAPEQAGGRRDIGPPADVYALGAVLYELLTGRPPFNAATAVDTLVQVVSEEPVPPRRLNPQVPRDLETICLKCLHKEAKKRYASAEALAEDLRRFQNGEPIQARPVGRPEKLARWCRRNPVVAGLLSLVALVLVAGTVISWYFAVEANHRARQASRRLYVADLRLVQQAWEQDQAGRVRDLLDNQKPEQTGGTDFRGFEWYYWDRLARAGLPAPEEHQWGVACVAFSPDGRLLASAGWDQVVNVCDARSGRVLHTLTGHADTIHGLAFSPDGRRLATASADKTIRVWDPETGRLLTTLTGHTAAVHAVLFTPDGDSLISAGEDRMGGGVKFWDVNGGPAVAALSHGSAVYGLALSPDGKRLASGGKDGLIRLWDTTTREPVVTLTGHTNTVAGLAFSPDGQRLASAGWDGTWRIWKTSGGPPLAVGEHGESVLGVAFSPGGKLLASACRARERSAAIREPEALVKLWSADDGRPVRSLPGHTLAARCVAFSKDGRRLASAGEDHTVRVWDLAAGDEPQVFGRKLTPLTFALDGSPLDSVGDHPLVRVWDRVGRQVTLTFTRHASAVSRVVFAPDGRHLASIDWKRTLILWDLDGHFERIPLPEDLGSPQSLAFSPHGERLAVGGRDRVVILDASAGGVLPGVLQGHTAPIKGVTFRPDGKRLATASEDGTVRVWAADSGAELHTLAGHAGSVTALAYAPDGSRLASAGEDGTVRVWDAEKGMELLRLLGHASTVTGVAFSPDGKRLASSGSDKTVRLWEAATGRELPPLKGFKGHSLGVTAVAFSPDDRPGVRRLASASEDGTVKLWDAVGGQEILTLRGHGDAVLGLSFSPDARRLASCGKDGTVKVWEATLTEDAPGR